VSSCVLDASALLAVLNQEEGSERVAEMIASGAMISAVNLSEVIAKLSLFSMPESLVREALDPLGLEVVPFDVDSAYGAALLLGLTKATGLSLGDRACLALAARAKLLAVTADRAWSQLQLDVRVCLIR
jgi:ribonuclease VapC